MTTQLMNMLAAIVGFAAGGMIGFGFGLVQAVARRRLEKRQQEGNFTSGWSAMPGSGARVAYLLIVLVLIQFLCPLFFRNGMQWWVSGGVVVGYGLALYRQLRQRLSERR